MKKSHKLVNPFGSVEQGQQQRAFNAEQFAGQPAPEFTQEQGLAARAEIMAAVREANLPLDLLVEIGDWAQMVIEQPEQLPEFQNWLREKGLPEEDIPQSVDYQELAGMAAVGIGAQGELESQGAGSEAELAPQSGSVAGPVAPEDLSAMAGQGRNGDTMLAHINADEAAMLQQMGGTGTVNPATGLPEFGFFSDLWNGFKKIVKKIAPIIIPAVAIFAPALIPAIGGALGATGTLASAVGVAVLSGGVTAISGGSMSDVLKSAAFAGLGSYLTPIVGEFAGKAVGITSQSLQSVLGSGIVAGGYTAYRGGSIGQILTAAATGAAGTYLGQIANNAINGTSTGAKVTNTKSTQQAFEDGAFIAADAETLAKQGMSSSQIKQILQYSGADPTAATAAANYAYSGMAADDITVKLANSYGAKARLYTNGQTGVQNSVIGGGNAEVLEMVQGSEDAKFIAADAKNMKALGLNAQQIQQNLEAAGVPPDVAKYAAGQAGADSLANNLTTQFANKNVNLFTDAVAAGTTARVVGDAPTAETQARLNDARTIAEDVKQLKAQGLSSTQIKQTLIASGVDPVVAGGASGWGNYDTDTIVKNLISSGSYTKLDSLYQYDSGVADARFADAQTIAADAKQLRAQGLGQTAIRDTLIASGVNSAAASQAAVSAMSSSSTVDSIANSIMTNSNVTKLSDFYTPTQTAGPVAPAETPGTPVSDTGGAQIGGGPAAPTDIRSTGYSDSAPGTVFNGPNGQEVVLNSGKTVLLADYLQAVDSGTPVSIDGMMPAGGSIRIEIRGVPYLADSYNLPADLQIPEGYRLATLAEADAGLAGQSAITLPDGRSAWVVPTQPATVIPGVGEGGGGGGGQTVYSDGTIETRFDDGSYLLDYPDGSTEFFNPDGTLVPPATPTTPPVTQPPATTPQPDGAPIATGGGTTTQLFDDGSALITYPDGSTVAVDSDGNTVTPGVDYSLAPGDTSAPGMGGGTGLLPGASGEGLQLPTMPGLPDMGGGQGITIPVTGGTVGEGGFVPDNAVPVLGDPNSFINDPNVIGTPVITPVTPVTPVTPYIPTPIPPTVPATPPAVQDGGYTLQWGTPDMPQTRFGLNPGLMNATPQYATTSPVQSQYYWGAPQFQTGGPTGQVFNPQVAQANPYAPPQPWGLQQMFQPNDSTAVLQQLLAGQNPYASVIPLTRQG